MDISISGWLVVQLKIKFKLWGQPSEWMKVKSRLVKGDDIVGLTRPNNIEYYEVTNFLFRGFPQG